MAYVYDYINNTLIDDEDKSLGNKLRLMDGGRIELDNGGDAFRLKALQADYDKFGKKKLDKAARVLGFKDYASMSGQENNNFRRKIKNELTKYGEVLPRYEADVRGRRTRIPKEQVIQIKLLEETNNKIIKELDEDINHKNSELHAIDSLINKAEDKYIAWENKIKKAEGLVEIENRKVQTVKDAFEKWKLNQLEQVAKMKLKNKIEKIDKAGLSEILNNG